MNNYFLDDKDIKVWYQMFFDDGSVTPGRYLPVSVFDDEEQIKRLALEILTDTHRLDGIIFIWGAGRIYARKCSLSALAGSHRGKTLRLRRL